MTRALLLIAAAISSSALNVAWLLMLASAEGTTISSQELAVAISVALAVVLVPLLALWFVRRRPSFALWAAPVIIVWFFGTALLFFVVGFGFFVGSVLLALAALAGPHPHALKVGQGLARWWERG